MTPEGKVKNDLKKALKQLHLTVFYMPVQNGMGVTGVPDFLGCTAGYFWGCETKAPGKQNNLTPNQAAWRDKIKTAGGLWFLVHDTESLAHMIGDLKLLAGGR